MNIELISLQGILCCLAFFFAGVVDSITGGGGLITIPVMLATGIPVHFITGTNQCSAWVGAYVSAYKYFKSGNVHLKSALITLPFAVIGSYFGARLNLIVPDYFLKLFMLIMVPVVAIFLFTNKKLGEKDYVDEKSTAQIVGWSIVIGLLLGAYQGFYGAGAGMFFMLAYVAFLKLSLLRATGNTRLVVAVASTASVITYALSGVVIWNLAIAAMFFNIAGSYLGSSLAIKNGAKVIRPIMLCVVVLLIIKIAFDFIT